MMTVQGLINILKGMNPNLQVVICEQNQEGRHGFFNATAQVGYIDGQPDGTFYSAILDDEEPNVVLLEGNSREIHMYFSEEPPC